MVPVVTEAVATEVVAMADKTSDLIRKSQAKRGAPGTLKRKVKGKMTLAKARALKNRPGATTLDKRQANFFINMHSESKRIPRKPGQPAGSDKHSDLYTDENPKGTIHGLKFTTVDDGKASVNKIERSGRKHAHKIQAAIAMEQRARVAGKKGAAAVYRKYINQMKKKTKEMNESLWANIHAKRRRGERMRKKGEKGAPTPDQIKRAQAASESTIRDNRPDHEIMRGSMGDARRKHDAIHGYGSFRKLPDHHKNKLVDKEIDQRFADRGRKPPKYTSKVNTTVKTSEEMTTTANIPNPADTAMGPRIKTSYMHDRRRKKSGLPVLLKRFRKYIDDNS